MEASFINIIVAGALGLLVSLTYIFTSEERSVNFARTLIVLPMLVCGNNDGKWKSRNQCGDFGSLWLGSFSIFTRK